VIITKKHLPRRSFLRGALGTMVALPFLDAMTPALSAQSKARPVSIWRYLCSEWHLPAALAPRQDR
jgi:hypothetical protein